MKNFEVKIHPNVEKFLKKLDKQNSERIKAKLVLLKEIPFSYLEHLEGSDYYKLRVGDYRALIDVDFSDKVIYVQVLDHRKKFIKNKIYFFIT